MVLPSRVPTTVVPILAFVDLCLLLGFPSVVVFPSVVLPWLFPPSVAVALSVVPLLLVVLCGVCLLLVDMVVVLSLLVAVGCLL